MLLAFASISEPIKYITMRATSTTQRFAAISFLLFLFLNAFAVFKLKAQTSVISGKVFWDCNNNDVRDATDAGIKNITVTLSAASNQPSAISTTTDSLGNYSFKNIALGSYKVVVSFPIGSSQLSFSTPVSGGDPTLNSDVDASGTTGTLVVVSGTNYLNIDAGIVDKSAPKIQFSNPLIQGLFNGDTLTVSCDNLPRMDSTWVTVNDNSKQVIAAVFVDNLLAEGNCPSNGFLKLFNCTWTATDACGNVGQVSIFVKVIDDKAPVLNNIPSDVTVNTYLGDVVPTTPSNISSTDACTAGNLGVQFSQNKITSPCGSTITRIWTSSDVCNNTSTKSQIIKIFDTPNCLVHNPIDSFKYQITVSRTTDSCINGIFGANKKITKVGFQTPANAHQIVMILDSVTGCLKLSALQTFNQPDTIKGTYCDVTGTVCRDFFLVITPQNLRLNSCNLFPQDSVVRIKLAACTDKGYFCINGVNDAVAFKNNYTISDNGAPYSGTLTGCQYDTTFSYTYFTIPKFGKAGPYRLDYWLLNGKSYKIAAFKDIFGLVDSMNVWDPIGKWKVDTLTLTISGGKSVNTYGQMKITRIANGSIGYLEMNSQLNSSGASVCFYAGTHEVIFKDNTSGCQDILRLVVTCDSSSVPKKPRATNDNVTVKKNSLIVFDPTLNDSLFNAPIRTLTITTPPKNGNYAYSGNTGVLYTPNTGFCGKDTLKYTICNNYFFCDSAFVFIDVTCDVVVLQKPVARPDIATTQKNKVVTIDFLANDTPNGALTSTTINKAPRRGTAVINNNKIVYTPQLDACPYTDTLQYKICNVTGCDSTQIIVAVTCPIDSTPTGKKPIAVNDNYTTNQNITLRFSPVTNDTINGILSGMSVNPAFVPKNGSIGFIGLDSLIYIPNRNFCGKDSFKYTITNNSNLSADAYIFITVVCDPVKPIAVVDFTSTKKNTPVSIDVLANDTQNSTFTITSITKNPRKGTAVFNGVKIDYTPQKDSCNYIDTLQYKICNTIGCDSAFVYVTVTCDPSQEKPIAHTDNTTTNKNSPLLIDVLANDTQNGALTSIEILKKPRRGIAVTNNYKIDYTPQKDSCNYTDTLQYKICNAAGCDSAFVYVLVKCDNPSNKKPIAVNDNITTPKNIPARFKPTVNDSLFGTIGSLSVVKGFDPKKGKVTFMNIDSVLYTPNADFCGLDTFRYIVCNSSNLCDSAYVFINVTCPVVQLKPVAVVDNGTTKKNTNVTIDILANDTQNPPLTSVTFVKLPSRGFATLTNNQLVYTPQKDSCGYTDTLQYKICNATGCDSAFVYVVVTCDVPLKPIARTDVSSTKKNVLVPIDVLANDTQNGVLTSVTITKAPKRGTAVFNNYKIDYTPQKDSCNYSDTLQYKICNATGCDSAMVFVNVTCDTVATPKKPVAVNDNVTSPKNVTARFKPTANDNLNGTLSSMGTLAGTGPKNGEVRSIGLDSMMYIPNTDFCGKDTFKYMVCNNFNLCDTAYVFITVTCDQLPKAPVAVADNATTLKNTPVTVDVLANDTQNCGTVATPCVTTTILKAPRRGTAVVNNNKIDYTPQKDSCGYSDTLQYKICNVIGCDSSIVIFSVTCPPDPTKKPVAVNDNASTNKNKTVTIDILANDTPNGTLTSTTIRRDPKKGKLVFNGNKIDYIPTTDSCGYIDTFQYRICNAIGCDSAFVFVNVSCDVPKGPKAVADNSTTIRNTPVTVNVLQNDTLNGVLSTPVVVTKNPKFGTTSVVNNNVVYTPSSGYCGVRDSFQYNICNINGCDSVYSYVTITCDSSNLKPIANPDSAITRKNTPIRISILANDQINGTLDSIKVTKSPLLGSYAIGSDNVLTYTPDSCGFIDSLRYRICNKNGCAETAVIILVKCDTAPPVKRPKAINDNATTSLNLPVTVNVTANDSLYSAPVDSVKVTTKPNHGNAVIVGNKVVYTPALDYCDKNDTLRYAVFTKGGSDTATVFIRINCKRPDSLPPVAIPDAALGNKNATLIIDVTANDTLRGSDTFRIKSAPNNGFAQFDSLNRIKYVPNKDFCGKDTLIYQIANSKGSDTAIVFINIDCGKINKDSLPIARKDSAKTLVNQPIIIFVAANDSLRGATQVVLIDSTMGIHGMARVNADGLSVTYTPFRNFFGIDSFRYQICNKTGCDTTTVYIIIDSGDSIVVYNGFSPNGDGMNDELIIQGIDKYADNEVFVWNRWGNEVFHTKAYSNSKPWDGRWNNLYVPDGTYYYCVYINDPAKGNIRKTGYLQIQR